MREDKYPKWPRPLKPSETVEKLAQACAALDKIARYTMHDEAYYGDPGTFAKHALDMIMEQEAQKMTTTVFPSDSKTLQVEVCYVRGTPAFICGANGRISGESIGEIEDGMNEEDAELFRDEGTYLFDAHYEQIGDIGVELEGYWDLTERGFRPLETEAQK